MNKISLALCGLLVFGASNMVAMQQAKKEEKKIEAKTKEKDNPFGKYKQTEKEWENHLKWQHYATVFEENSYWGTFSSSNWGTKPNVNDPEYMSHKQWLSNSFLQCPDLVVAYNNFRMDVLSGFRNEDTFASALIYMISSIAICIADSNVTRSIYSIPYDSNMNNVILVNVIEKVRKIVKKLGEKDSAWTFKSASNLLMTNIIYRLEKNKFFDWLPQFVYKKIVEKAKKTFYKKVFEDESFYKILRSPYIVLYMSNERRGRTWLTCADVSEELLQSSYKDNKDVQKFIATERKKEYKKVWEKIEKIESWDEFFEIKNYNFSIIENLIGN